MDSIYIEGYKSLKKIDLPLKKINLLIGSNGSGKSNFLSLFDFLGNVYNGRLAQAVVQMGGIDKLFHNGRKATERIKVSVVDGNNAYELSLVESDGSLIIENERLGHTQDAVDWTFTDITNYKPETSLQHYSGLRSGEYIKEYMSQIKKFHFHDTGRLSPFNSDSDVINDSYHLYSNGENIASILLKIKNTDTLAFRRIVKVVQCVAPFFHDFYLQPNEGGKVRLQWQDKYSETIYGPNDLSDGTLRFIALTTLFMQPKLPKVIVIDEPELGLHPVAIDKLAGLIKIAANRGTQIIAATQSAELISNFTPEDILTVDHRDGDSQIRRLDEQDLSLWYEDYTLGELWKQKIIQGGQPK